MPSRGRPLVAGNWKMHKTVAEARSSIAELLPRLPKEDDVDVVVCAPFTALAAAAAEARGSRVAIAAQNMHEADAGGHTGEVSAPMLVDLEVEAVVLGHSERRRDNGESDRALQSKVPAALAAGLVPILCVGESEEERERGDMQRRLRAQVQEALEDVPLDRLAEAVIAYEPVWAIGTGHSATPEQAQEAISFVRALVGDRSVEAAEEVRVLYGGSVTPANTADLVAQPDIDGVLVGGASLDAEGLAEIVRAAAGERR